MSSGHGLTTCPEAGPRLTEPDMYVCMYVCIYILEQSTHGVAITAQSLGQVRDMREQVRHSHKTHNFYNFSNTQFITQSPINTDQSRLSTIDSHSGHIISV